MDTGGGAHPRHHSVEKETLVQGPNMKQQMRNLTTQKDFNHGPNVSTKSEYQTGVEIMPIGIIISDTAIPTIIEETNDQNLFNAIRALKICPNFENIQELKTWLNSLPQPAGWYATRAGAKAAAQRAANHKPAQSLTKVDVAELVKETRAILGISRVEFGRQLGFNGNDNTVNKTVYELEQQKANLRPEKLDILHGLRANIELDEPGSFTAPETSTAKNTQSERLMA